MRTGVGGLIKIEGSKGGMQCDSHTAKVDHKVPREGILRSNEARRRWGRVKICRN